ncbi:hypothetical protein Kpol_1024p48 [Vanderwaltozyma polyspora DSM 70294]|uniref:Uncharacterized protein n=1 Tax=Vanderwaltozyma polyspora (strain ATCC 22028 / DSM 70294 / BCRC 21397 / CBS 2163 / NBRC 10782 / NRRL Y-8283 / UCD 57-17) TaxID=436907 RepID=A7TLK8_VANPO|nr:uncharacterized protein Kpol_1024p48 [Vanderwaltozyma polyspora DSM 70294]EDO16894.1 hypothetical protein Kpol_1024p48 [Vanderwaltozyma polyspora DSM 70294]
MQLRKRAKTKSCDDHKAEIDEDVKVESENKASIPSEIKLGDSSKETIDKTEKNSVANTDIVGTSYCSFKKPKCVSNITKDKELFVLDGLVQNNKLLQNMFTTHKENYYKDLTCPRFIGYKNFELLRLPSDVEIFERINSQINNLVERQNNSTKSVSNNIYSSPIPKHMNPIKQLSIMDTAKLHNIDISSIKDTIIDSNYSDRLSMKLINKSIDKPFTRVRDNNKLIWPSKQKKRRLKNHGSEEVNSLKSHNSIEDIPWLS